MKKKNNDKTLGILKEHEERTRTVAKKTINEYKNFAIKGNIVDMAIGVAIGSAFTNIVNSLVSTTITPLIGFFTSDVDLSNMYISLKGEHFATIEEAKTAGSLIWNYGALINSILNFFIISIVLFVVVSFIQRARKKLISEDEKTEEITTKTCKYCLSTVPIHALKCAYCTSELECKVEQED